MISSRILLAGLFCLCPFSLAQKIEPDPKNTLIIISTSDIHGNLDKFPKLATLVKKYRSKFPHVMLMDSGDISWAITSWPPGKNPDCPSPS